MEFDTRTLVLILSISNALMGCTMLWVFRDSKEVGVNLWIASLFMKAVSTGALLFFGTLPSLVFAYAVPLALTGAYTLNYLALCIVLGYQRNAWVAYGPLAAAALMLVLVGRLPFYPVVGADLVRTFLIAAVILLLLRHGQWRKDRAHSLVLVGFLLGLLVFGGRVIANIFDSVSFDNFDRSNVGRSVTFVVSFMVSILTSFGLVLMYRNRAIAKLLASEDSLRKFKAIVNSSEDAIISKSLSGVIESWNLGAERLFGYSVAEAIGTSMQKLISNELLHEEREILARIARGEKVEHFETVRRHKDGHLIDVATTVSPILDESARVVGASSISRDVSQRKRLEDQVRQLAFHDTLTQLPNRRLLMDRLQQAINGSKRSERYGALVFIDLDNFKPINDMHGHDAGDLLLLEVARRLTSSVRQIDTVARFGGDEFVVLLGSLALQEDESTAQAMTIAEKFRLTLAEPYLLTVKREVQVAIAVEHRCTASIGVAVFGGQNLRVDEVLRRADQAMYQAKNAGRNSIRFYGLTP